MAMMIDPLDHPIAKAILKTCRTCDGWGFVPDNDEPGLTMPCPKCRPARKRD